MLKQTLLVTFLLTSAAAADTVSATIQDHYRSVTESIPTTRNVCQNVEVPIYGTQSTNNAGGGALLGMIIGGVIGDAISDGNGGATAGGAIIGGVIGADRAQNNTQQVITGYRTERQCTEVTSYTDVTRNVYSHSTISFVSDGERVTLRFNK